MISQARNIALAISVALLVGYTAGYYAKGQFVKADQYEAVTEARSETAVDIQESLKQSTATEQEVTASTKQVVAIRKTVAARVQPKTQEASHEANLRTVCPDSGIDVGTVRLLNSARDGSALDTASLVDGASKAASGIGLPELLDNDLEVVQLYRELAIRHDALVDFVESKLQQQANQ